MNTNQIIINNEVDGILVTSMISIRYLAKFTGTEAQVVITKDNNYILVDSRYFEQAKKQCTGFEVLLVKNGEYNSTINQIIKSSNIESLGFEDNKMSVFDFDVLTLELDADLVGLSLDEIRMIKTNEEIDLIKKAVKITDDAYTHLLDFVKIGMSEKSVDVELQKFILDQGASGLSFTTIVASGERGSMPHGVASDKLIEENDFVTLDFGVFYDGYASDMTRTFAVGSNPDDELVKIYNVVLEAQLLAIKAIKPGIVASSIDNIARSYIKDAGYAEYFKHGLGHSIGLEIHELPNLNPSSTTVLEPGHIVTVEPGIYIPGLGGVRIEDDVLVTEDGYEILNKSSKDLIKIDGR